MLWLQFDGGVGITRRGVQLGLMCCLHGEQCALLLDAKRGSHGRDFCDRVSCAGKKGSLAQQEDSDQKLLRVAESKIDRPAVMLAEGAEVGFVCAQSGPDFGADLEP